MTTVDKVNSDKTKVPDEYIFRSVLLDYFTAQPVDYTDSQSTVGKKMAAVHFTTIPCEPNTAYKTQGKPNFYNICPCTKDIVYRRFEDFITLLYLFMNVVKVFVR